ncbi:hypothetical protein Mal35_51210 [Gimesia maris]|nr:hypothetical protein Mal35_51210 [Gimesia maris]
MNEVIDGFSEQEIRFFRRIFVYCMLDSLQAKGNRPQTWMTRGTPDNVLGSAA